MPTLHRPVTLDAALRAVRAEAVRCAADRGVDVDLLVVDNDPAGSAGTVARAHGARHVTEPVPGLSAVRNRALDEAAAHDLLVFLDDDEVPEPGWLVALLDTHRATGAAAVAGPVRTLLPPGADDWVRASYVRPARVDGQRMAAAATNNLLLDLAAVRAAGVRFDPALGLTGGEDTQFTSDLVRAGGTIRWCAGARVVESVGPARLDHRWILRRAFRSGVTEAVVALRAAPTLPARGGRGVLLAAGGVARMLVGTGLHVVAHLRRSPGRSARAARMAARGAGHLAGLVGNRQEEYAHRHRLAPQGVGV
ncbi:glycosyltransferase family 2 protein [Cellulomonas sp. zg-ZUI222]|uniref:glycosyltransferase family 2 protein n=1 Tax=Cellulomonas wangleii TaxID=2816956 RepID=UPI001A93C4CB|nr:glycosyltransferase family 2 protein [Cellulomonas wangleii]MBO0922200.1 glycosyltransferase family 2 protein [Cellulomonas wangleii]